MNRTDEKLMWLALRSGHSLRSLNALKLFHVPLQLRPNARKEFKDGDAVAFVGMAPSQAAMRLVLENAYPLLKQGILEKAFMAGYVAGRVASLALLNDTEMKFLLDLCDKEKLREAGEPLPPGDNFRLYRGVADGDDMRSARRWSWTSSPGKARRFAEDASNTHRTDNPAVFMLDVDRRQILAYTNQRQEQEYIVNVREKDKPIRMDWGSGKVP